MPAIKPPEFRRRALALVAGGEPVAQVAKNLGIRSRACGGGGGRSTSTRVESRGLTSAEKQGLVELRRKNRVLELEVEILKRGSAYFALENVLPQ